MRDSHLVRRAPSRKMRQAVRVGERPVGNPSESGFVLQDAGFDPQPRPLLDRLPTSDTLWMAGRKLSPKPGIRSGAIFGTLVCYSRDARSGVIVFEWVRADCGLLYPFGFGFTVMVYRISSFRARFVPARQGCLEGCPTAP